MPNKDPLTHHERLRYEYLLQNLSYLNEKETAEFNYLEAKRQNQITDNYNHQREVVEPTQTNYAQQPSSISDRQREKAIAQARQLSRVARTREQALKGRQTKATNQTPVQDSRTANQTRPAAVYQESQQYHQGQAAAAQSQLTGTVSEQAQVYETAQAPQTGQKQVAQGSQRQTKGQGTVKKASAVQQPAQPKNFWQKLKQKVRRPKFTWKRFFLGILLFLMIIFLGMVLMFFKGVNYAKTNYSEPIQEVFNGESSQDGINILILGSDQRVTEESSDARTDTIMVMNIGNSEGTIKLVSFMRDTLVHIDGYSSSDYALDYKLNTAFNLGEHEGNFGADYMRQTLKENYDMNIDYYVMFDFETFAEAINSLFPNGVTIDAQFGTVNGQTVSSVEVPDDLNMENGVVPNQTINVGTQQMDGRTLLNYARFRSDDDADFGRVTRQQQVISAVLSQIKNPMTLFTGPEAIGKVVTLSSTNVPLSVILQGGVSLVKAGSDGIVRTTVPEQGDWIDDYDQFGGMGLWVDFEKYKQVLSDMGMR